MPIFMLFLTETLGSFVLGIGPRLIIDSPTMSNNDPLFTAVLIAAQVVVRRHGESWFGVFVARSAFTRRGGLRSFRYSAAATAVSAR